jgi:hypothetical protein
MFVGPALRLRKKSSPGKVDIFMLSRGPKPTPEPVIIPDEDMEPTPNIVEIGSSAIIVKTDEPTPMPTPARKDVHLQRWEAHIINNARSIVNKRDREDSPFTRKDKSLIKQGLKILDEHDIDGDFMFQGMGSKKKQRLYENDDSYLLHKDKKPNTGTGNVGQRLLMGYPFEFWGLEPHSSNGFSDVRRNFQSEATQSTGNSLQSPTQTGNSSTISNLVTFQLPGSKGGPVTATLDGIS